MASAVVLALVLGLVVGLVLYALVRAEHDERETMDRAAAERVARRDTRDPDGRHEDSPGVRRPDGEWGSDDSWGRENG